MDQRNIENKSNASPINELPDEMLLHIFSYLQVADICNSVSTVCQRWNSICTADMLWKSKWLRCGNSMTFKGIKKALSEVPLLQAIELQWRTDVDLIIDTLIKCCENICKINLVCCGNLKSKTVSVLVQNYPFLQHLSMEKCWSVQNSCYEMVPNFIHLKSLNISHANHFPGSTFKEIVDLCTFLVDLNIDYIRGITDNEILYLICKRGSALLSLVLFGECLTDSSFCSLEKCVKLCKLHISRCDKMTNKGLLSIGKLTNLHSLKLRFGINVTSEELNTFLESKAVCNLSYLGLSRSQNFTDHSATIISNNCKKLRQLDVMFCPNLSEVGCQVVLKNCELLHTLHFSGDYSSCEELNLLLESNDNEILVLLSGGQKGGVL